MNVNSQPPVLVINAWLKFASDQLKVANITSARLDAEIILAHTLQKSRTYLHAHPDEEIEISTQKIAETQLNLRIKHMPIAYITGHKEFYGRDFLVTNTTLIPRPESERVIDTLKTIISTNQIIFDNTDRQLIDVGTGSGCLGITAKLEIPELEVTLLDISSDALKIAIINAKLLRAEVTLTKSDLLYDCPLRADIIVANLPYVDRSWQRSPETDYEPAIALFADNGGRALIYKLIDQSVAVLDYPGLLLLEADPSQHQAITNYAKQKGFRLVIKQDYCLVFKQS